MKFAKSIIAITSALGLSSAVNVEGIKEDKEWELSMDKLHLLGPLYDIVDPNNELGFVGAMEICFKEPKVDFCE